jgi:tol-pal system protein YbgF
VLLAGTTACGGAQVQQLETNLRTLRDEVDEIKRGQAAARVQADELRNRIVMVEEKADSARVDRSRRDSAWIPKLPTVRVDPQGAMAAVPPTHAPPAHARPSQPQASDPESDDRSPVLDSTEQRTPPAIVMAPPSPAVPSGPAWVQPPQAGPPAAAGDDAVSRYNHAKGLLDAGQLTVARTLFGQLRDAHPDHELADNALYWMGESWYAEAQWLKAAQAFVRVAKEYPRGNKVPDALYKLAKSYERVGDAQGAGDVLRQLARQFPGTPMAKRALDDLERRPSRAAAP